jgi:hypothetical protein
MEEEPADEVATEDKKSGLSAWSKYAFATLPVIVVAVYLFMSGWGGYAFAYVKCGVQQPLIAYTIENSQIYYPPDNRRYSVPGEGAFFSGYYCGEPQAVADGFLRAGP